MSSRPLYRQMVGGDVPRVRAAAYDIRRTHQNVHPVLARRLRCGDRGGKFGDDAAKLARFEHMFAGGVIVAGTSAIFRSRQMAAMRCRLG